jgi:hypothetical protein
MQSGLENLPPDQLMADEHALGGRDYSASLWSLLMFEVFLRQSENI